MTKCKAWATYSVIGIGVSLICLLLIPTLPLIFLICFLWKLTDKAVKKLESF